LAILELNFLVSNFLGIGFATYKDESILFGESGVNITKYMVIFIMLIPFYLKYEKNKSLRILASILLISGIIIVILGMKRSAILAISGGFLVYALMTPYKSRILRITPFITAFVLLSGPYYIPIIEKRFKARQERVSMTYNQLSSSEEEGRLLEVQYTIEQTFGDSFDRIFIGYDLFLKKQFQGHRRMLHIDYMNMLGGAGIIGLSFFLFIYCRIWFFAKKIKRTGANSLAKNEIFAMICALLGVQAFMSFGGTMQGLDLRGTILLLLGAFLALGLQELKKENIVYGS
jgi:O-antigen ligase